VLRQPLEDGSVTIARAAMALTFPARFMLAAAMNPCPCGFRNDRTRECPLHHSNDPALHLENLGPAHGTASTIHIDVPAVKLQRDALDQRARKLGKRFASELIGARRKRAVGTASGRLSPPKK